MQIHNFLIAVLLAGLNQAVAWTASPRLGAQDASGRDPAGKPAVKPAPKVTPPPAPKPTPIKVASNPKPTKPPVKTVTNNRKTASAAVAKKTPPPAVTAKSRLILSAVPNAQIELAGKLSGATDATGKLLLNDTPYGTHSLKVTAEGYEPWSGSVEVKTAVTDFAVSLKKRVTTGSLAITVNQPGADVFINERLNVKSVAGQQITVDGLLPGTHQLRAVKPGYKEWRNVVRVTLGEISRVEIVLAPGISPEMVRVPAGEFIMGNDKGPEDSRPAHPVVLGEFAISRREITNQFYQNFLEATKRTPPDPQLSGWQGANFPTGRADAPVVGVTWDDATAFCKWLSQETGMTYRLPTEAEWERATRAVGNVYQVSVVWEWCQDWYDAEYYQSKDRLNPQGPLLTPQPSRAVVQGRVIRGGAASAAGRAVRVFERNAAPPIQGRSDSGFRVVREITAR
jgi:formylglycine-generating enzyme required for sulfatase activity